LFNTRQGQRVISLFNGFVHCALSVFDYTLAIYAFAGVYAQGFDATATSNIDEQSASLERNSLFAIFCI